jgi:hypothetical protein
MAATRDCDFFSLPAGAATTDGAFGKQVAGAVVNCSVLGERADVIIGGAALVAGDMVDVGPRSGKIIEVKVGAVAVLIDAELTPDANGLAKTAVSTNVVRARALQAGAIGATIRALWVDAYIKP